MTTESAFIESLRALATDPAARGLIDDAAVLQVGGETLVLTHDMMVEGVHYLPDDPPDDVAWKLVAVNLSDLAAKGARPIGVLLGYGLGDGDWDSAFARGMASALGAFALPLLGGDTVGMPAGAPRVLGLTAIGAAYRRGAGAQRREAGRPSLGQRHDRRCRRGAEASPQRADRTRRPRRALSQSAAAPRGGRAARPGRDGDDGRLRRPADRHRPHGRRERLPGRDRARRRALVRRISRLRRRRPRRPARRRHGGRRLRAARSPHRRPPPTACCGSPRRSGFPCRASVPSSRARAWLSPTTARPCPCPIVSVSNMPVEAAGRFARDRLKPLEIPPKARATSGAPVLGRMPLPA